MPKKLNQSRTEDCKTVRRRLRCVFAYFQLTFGMDLVVDLYEEVHCKFLSHSLSLDHTKWKALISSLQTGKLS
jgi:hypothetical protein